MDDMVISRLIFFLLGLKRVLASYYSGGALSLEGLSYLLAFLIGCKLMLVMDFGLSVLRLGLFSCFGFFAFSTPLFYRVGDGLPLAATVAVSFYCAASAPLFADSGTVGKYWFSSTLV